MRAEQKALAHLQKAVAYLDLEFGVKHALELNSELPSKTPRLSKKEPYLHEGNLQVRVTSIEHELAGAGLFYVGENPIPKGTFLWVYGGHPHRCTNRKSDYKFDSRCDAADPKGSLVFKTWEGGDGGSVTSQDLALWNRSTWAAKSKEGYGYKWVPGIYDNTKNTTNLMRFANHATGECANMAMASQGNKNYPAYGFYAKEVIYPGDELLYSYGVDYWDGRGIPRQNVVPPTASLAMPLDVKDGEPGYDRRKRLRDTNCESCKWRSQSVGSK